MKSNKELREVAKDLLMTSIATSYYKLEDSDYSDDELEKINTYLFQYGTAMGKAIKKDFYTM